MSGFFRSVACFVGKTLFKPSTSSAETLFHKKPWGNSPLNIFSRPDISTNSPTLAENSHSPREKTAGWLTEKAYKIVGFPARMKKHDVPTHSQSPQPKITTGNHLSGGIFSFSTFKRPSYMKKDYKSSMFSESLDLLKRETKFASEPSMAACNHLNRGIFYRCMKTLNRPAYVKKAKDYNISMYSQRLQSLIRDHVFAGQPEITADNYPSRGMLNGWMTSLNHPVGTNKAKSYTTNRKSLTGEIKNAVQPKAPSTRAWNFSTPRPAGVHAALCAIGATLCKVGQIQRIYSQTVNQITASRQKHSLPDLAYDYGALEPHISGQIMQLHHGKHHAAYVSHLCVAEEKYQEALAKGDVAAQLVLQPALWFNAGGHINHTIFWTNLSPDGGGEPRGKLLRAIKRDFGSFQNMKEEMSAVTAAVAVQGSAWVWLGYDKDMKRLRLAVCANQDPLEATTGLVPLLGIDAWEHAYYLQYKNVRKDYVKAIWNVINWENVSDRFLLAKKQELTIRKP